MDLTKKHEPSVPTLPTREHYANKEWECSECLEPIHRGEKYLFKYDFDRRQESIYGRYTVPRTRVHIECHPGRIIKMATEKQLAFIETLRRERPGADDIETDCPPEDMSVSQASFYINQLLKLPPRPKLAAVMSAPQNAFATPVPEDMRFGGKPDVTEDGMYMDPVTSEIYKVQANKVQGGGSRLYAKQLVIIRAPKFDEDDNLVEPALVKFTYKSGLIFQINPLWKMKLEHARVFGALYGVCVNCGSPLTDEKSIERGMGPVCAGRFE